MVLSSLVVMSLLPLGSDAAPTKFVHPGVLIGPDQLAFVRAQSKIAGTPANITLAKVCSRCTVAASMVLEKLQLATAQTDTRIDTST